MQGVVFHQGALGDFLAAASCVDALCGAHPELHIDFWSKPEHVSLLAQKHYVGECFSLDGALIPSLFHDDAWRTVRLPDFLLRSDQVFIFGQKGSRILASRLSRRLTARVDWIRSFPASEDGAAHVRDFIGQQLRGRGWRLKQGLFTLIPSALDLEAVRQLLHTFDMDSPPVFIHPGSGGIRKVWPLKHWHALLGWIKRANAGPALLSVGPADDYLNDFAATMQASGVPVVQGLTLSGLTALLACCRVFIGSDSGVSHLAAAAGVPTVAIFGAGNSMVWAPRGREVSIVQRSWEESEVLDWGRFDTVTSADEEIASAILRYSGLTCPTALNVQS